MGDTLDDLKNEAIAAATQHIRDQRKRMVNIKVIAVCVTILLGVAMVCGAVVTRYSIKAQQDTIIEQQYALNMQYAQLMEYVAGAEITENTAESDGDGSVSVAGDGNITAGGDVNGK